MRLLRLIVLLSLLPVLTAATERSRARTSAPVEDYAVSFFSDEGYPRVRVLGSAADLANAERIRLTAMELILYRGGIDRTVDTTLTAPIAILEPSAEIVRGPESVELDQVDLSLSGEDWIYEHRESRVLVKRNARVVFKMPLGRLLE
jgi:hypothetical protein